VDEATTASLSEETAAAGSARTWWYSEYVGVSYRAAVERALADLEGTPLRVLKTDLWNESLGGPRDVAGAIQGTRDYRFFGVDLAYSICARARSRVAQVAVVQADIRALPFRTGLFDAVLDLSTLDHLPEIEAAATIGGYQRLLRRGGVLLLIFWQDTIAMRARRWFKALLGRREKPGQHYLSRRLVRARLEGGFGVRREFTTGLLLLVPQRWTTAALSALPKRFVQRLLHWIGSLESSAAARPLLAHLTGLYGVVAIRQPDGTTSAATAEPAEAPR
jgi:SAM-dependent methyltransferase